MSEELLLLGYRVFVSWDAMIVIPPHQRVKEILKDKFPHLLFSWELQDLLNKYISNDPNCRRRFYPVDLTYKLARVVRYVKGPTRPLSGEEWSQWYAEAEKYTFACETPQERADAWIDAKWLVLEIEPFDIVNFIPHYPPSRILETFDRMSMSLWMFPISPTPTYDEMLENEHDYIQEAMKGEDYRKALQEQLPIVVRKRWIERNLQKVWHKLNDIKFDFV